MNKKLIGYILKFALAVLIMMQACVCADNDNFEFVREYDNYFIVDVSEGDWYYDSVVTMYKLGLTDGYAGTYMPDKDLTIAEAVTIAARLHSIYYTGSTYDADNYISGASWYDTYMAYAEDNGIIDDRFHGMEESPALRKYAAYIFSTVFEMEDINSIYPENIPDLDDEYSYYIISAYNIGLMTGVDDNLTFEPDGTLRRCEAAAIAVRCALPDMRITAEEYIPENEVARGIIRINGIEGSSGILSLSKKTSPYYWEEIMSVPCRIGRNGLYKTREGDGKTPCGTFPLGMAFGIEENPGTELEYIQLNENHYWVDDPASAYYNQFVDTGYVSPDWNSAEHLISESPAYDYAIDTGYNFDCTPGIGSAIFIHCSTGSPTNGCISISKEDMITLLQNVPANTTVVIEE